MLDFLFDSSSYPFYYGSILIFASVSFVIASTYLSFVRDYEELLQKWESFKGNKEKAKTRRVMETRIAIQRYPFYHPGRFHLVAFLFWIGAVLDITYMISYIFRISNILWVGKLSFLVVFIASVILFVLTLRMAVNVLKIKIRHWRGTSKDPVSEEDDKGKVLGQKSKTDLSKDTVSEEEKGNT